MKALILKANKELEIKNIEIPLLSSHEVLIKISASALNHRELWISKGLYPGMKLPCILGADGAGVVKEIGEKVDPRWLNKSVIIYPAYDWGPQEQAPNRNFRVLGMPDPGTIADYIKVPVANLVEKPDYLTFTEAAATPIAGLTSWRALTRHGKIKSGDNVLITGIGGGVAQAGLEFVKAFGANAYVTSSSQEKIDSAIRNGASGGVLYTSKDWNAQLKDLSKGIDIVLDSSPSEVLDDYYKFMNYGGRIITYGSTGSPKTSISISKFFLRHIQFIGTAMGSPVEFKAMLEFMTKHEIKPAIHSVFKFEEAINAFSALSTGKQIGKIVIQHQE